MKFSNCTYALILCLTIALFLKVGNVMSYLSYASVDIENVSSNDDATEKEEKKVETEFFTQHFNFIENTIWAEKEQEKLIVPASFNKLTYFSEVLTPPPSV